MAGVGHRGVADPKQSGFLIGGQRLQQRPAPRVCPPRHLHTVAAGPSATAPAIDRPILLNGKVRIRSLVDARSLVFNVKA